MVGRALDALEDVPITEQEQGGQRYLGNAWGMGPFYSWDFNYSKKKENEKE